MKKGIYIQMVSIHGLLRNENLELGRDADTGGQILYVLELAKQLSVSPGVRKVDIFTRLISDKNVSPDYAVPVQKINDKLRIVRIQCGGRKYVRKELLWPSLDEYINRTIRFLKSEGDFPDFVHGHYADAGYVSMGISRNLGIPCIFTGHSLGRSKRSRLLNEGMKESEIIRKFKIDHRIRVEEEIIQKAGLIIASTSHEVDQQYGMYDHHRGADFKVIPPGLDLKKFYPFYHEPKGPQEEIEKEKFAIMNMKNELNRFFLNPEKPLIMTICRPEKRKNINGLIEAFGKDKELQAIANLAIFAGIRKDITKMEDNEKDVLTDMLLLMDKYDLYGNMAIPKTNDFEYEVPALYRHAAESQGVFTNIALIEPFGLTLIEASACGVPIVATNNGGPVDIVGNLKNGITVDPKDYGAISGAIKQIITDRELWSEYSRNGALNIAQYYTWKSHCDVFLRTLKEKNVMGRGKEKPGASPYPERNRMAALNFLLITDIDNTLIGDDNSGLPELIRRIKLHRGWLGFGVSTGRTVESALDYLAAHGVPSPDIVITSVGTEIYYGDSDFRDQGWSTHISRKWDRSRIKDVLEQLSFLEYQEDETQREFKISYYMSPDPERLKKIHHLLKSNGISYSLIYSHDQFLDIVPYRASKGKAMKYIGQKWNIPMANILVSGDSGNDESMLRGGGKGVVVSNYSSELEKLRGLRSIYFSRHPSARGILEGLEYFSFLNK